MINEQEAESMLQKINGFALGVQHALKSHITVGDLYHRDMISSSSEYGRTVFNEINRVNASLRGDGAEEYCRIYDALAAEYELKTMIGCDGVARLVLGMSLAEIKEHESPGFLRHQDNLWL